MIEGTGFGVGSLGIVAGIVLVVSATVTEIGFRVSLMEWNTGMTQSLERGVAVGTFNSLDINRLMALRTVRHDHKRLDGSGRGDRDGVRVSSLMD